MSRLPPLARKVRYHPPAARSGVLALLGAGILGAALLGSSAGCSGPTVSKLTYVLQATPSALAFGDAPVGETTRKTLGLKVTGTGGVTLKGFELTGAGKGAFVAPALPAKAALGPAASVTLEVGFDPSAVGDAAATLVIHSTATAGDLSIPLTGTGKAAHIALCHPLAAGQTTPDCAAPGQCLAVDFGHVAPGGSATAGILVRNVGQAKLTVDAVTPAPGTTAAGFSAGKDLTGTKIVVGGGVDLPLAFAAPAAGTGAVTGKLEIASNDPDQPTACVDLSATVAPNQAPTACAAAVQIVHGDGSVATPADPANPQAGPGDRVVFTAHPTSSCSGDPEGDPLTYAWSLTGEPALSGAAVANPAFGPAPGSGDPPPYVDVDAVGTYTVALTVADPQGLTSPPAAVTVNAVPADDLTVQLAWHVDADLDLHLIAPGGVRFCQTLDCYWDTCAPKSPGVPVLDWGPDTTGDGKLNADGIHADDPLLVFDNLGQSIRPGTTDVRLETIRMGQAQIVPGEHYVIGVNYFADHGVQPASFDATLEVDHRGTVVSTQTVTFQKSAVGGWYQATLDLGVSPVTVSAFTAGTPTGAYTGPVICQP